MSASWLPFTTDPRLLSAVEHALDSVGICEVPPGSNRGAFIDAWVRDAGSPLGSPWCACAVRFWWTTSGMEVPPSGAGSCDVWMKWAQRTARWTSTPQVGSLVVYGKPGDARHIGLVVRTDPIVLSVEGNTTVEGAEFDSSREGRVVSLKEITKTDAVLGYIRPLPQ